MSPYVGRLAPSPTGLLHVGHARTFAVAAHRAAGGRLLLRVDDLDRERCRGAFVEAMLQDLDWLGLVWEPPMVLQSERLPQYEAALGTLLDAGVAYPCTCSRRDLQVAIAAPHEGDDEPVYNGRCRPAPGTPAAAFSTGVSYRLRVPDGEAVGFIDGNLGPQRFVGGANPADDFGDFVLWRRDGLPAYQLATVVDDAAMGVTEVVRGRDLLRSTARQLLLARTLGLQPPAFFHTELLRDANGVRLAKRHDALAVRTLRERGWSADDVLHAPLARLLQPLARVTSVTSFG